MKKYIVELTTEQRQELSRMISTGKAAARELTHVRILLKADQGPEGPAWSDSRIPRARRGGRCGDWPSTWWNWATSSRSATRWCARSC